MIRVLVPHMSPMSPICWREQSTVFTVSVAAHAPAAQGSTATNIDGSDMQVSSVRRDRE